VIQDERIRFLNDEPVRKGRYVLYWMQQAQRADGNHALEYAIREANATGLPVVVVFGVTRRFPGARRRHYAFMLDGLAKTFDALRERGVRPVVRLEPPPQAVAALADRAALIVTDRGYLRIQRSWRRQVASAAACRVAQVESDVVIPVEMASDHEEYAARTIRPKIERQLDGFLVPLEQTDPARDASSLRLPAGSARSVATVAHALGLPHTKEGETIRAGTAAARDALAAFVAGPGRRYASDHNDPGLDASSHLSPYLHFGQISPVEVALAVRHATGMPLDDRADFLEELIVRRELSMNFCHYNDAYDRYECLPEWARMTLAKHARDPRPWLYTRRQLERAETHDPYWNAAQREMVLTGFMHGYMRMYWGKKIIEWSPSAEVAFETALELNNAYELDGRDPNSFAGVAWCFGKHDRPWQEREVFGTVRWMSPQGLERKFDMERYVDRVAKLGQGG